jgi:hypothetical protein
MKSLAGPPALSPGRKRHLPIVKAPAEEDAAPPRPAWQWVGFGALIIFVVWLPLSAIALAVGARLEAIGTVTPSSAGSASASVLVALLSVSALAIAGMSGGFLVGKWGGTGAPVANAALAGAAASAIAVAGSWVAFGFAPGALLVVPIAVAWASLGGWLGRRAS